MRTRSRYIPKNALPIAEPNLGVVYVYPYQTPLRGLQYGVIAFREKAIHSDFHFVYRTEAEVDRKIEAFFDGIRQHKKLVQDRREKDYAGHNFHVGDIVTNSWGYDQTNVDWYLVKRISKNYVWLKTISCQLIPDESPAPMAGYSSISLDEHLQPIESDKPETKHRATGDYVAMKYGCGSKWTGQQKYTSWYA